MFCSSCGNQMPDDARFCACCGAPVPPPPAAEPPTPIPPPPAGFPASAPPPPTHVASGPGSFGSYGAPPPPGERSRLGLWIGIAIAAVIIIAAAIAVPLLLLGRDDGSTSSTTDLQTTSTTSPGTTDTQTTSSSAATSTTAVAGAPGDSPGEWVELDNSALPTGAYSVAVSEQALIVNAREDDSSSRFVAYMLDSGDLIELPVDAPEIYGADIDGLLAVWWEGTYDDTGYTTDEHIYAYLLPDGPKTELAGGGEWLSYPQVASRRVTWVSGEPLESNPDEYWHLQISGVTVDASGRPQGDPTVLVPSATAFAMGDSTWVYSLSDTRLAWEQATALGTLDPGTYTMDLNGTLQPVRLGSEIWRPSLGGGSVVYYEDGLKATNLAMGTAHEIDPFGDFATAGPTYAAYFRTIESADEWSYEIVARGFTGNYEQVLGEQYDAPWMSPSIAASAHHVAFIVDGVVHVFEWQGQGR